MGVWTGLLTCSLLETRALHRTLRFWPFVVLAFWPVLVKLQEPDFFRRQGVPFYWASIEALLLAATVVLPLALRFAHGPDDEDFAHQVGRSPAHGVLRSWLALLVYGIALYTFGCGWAALAERILPGPAAPLSVALAAGVRCTATLAVLATGAALVTGLRWRTPAVVFFWLAAAGLALQFFGPGPARDFSASERNSPPFFGIVSTLCATLGGLAFSFAHGLQRHRT